MKIIIKILAYMKNKCYTIADFLYCMQYRSYLYPYHWDSVK